MIRPASAADLVDLFDLEKATMTAALAHVFPPELPYPDDDVLSRWALVLADPVTSVVVEELAGSIVGYAAFGAGWLRHLGVAPSHWGEGTGRRLHAAALAGLAAAGTGTAYLWVLVDNHRARAFYAHAGWTDTGVREPEVFAPWPVKMTMSRPVGAKEDR